MNKIGFIGQGWIGKNYADNYEERGFDIVRYDLTHYPGNKEKIKECDITFIAVPTPSTPEGFDYSIVDEVLDLIGEGNIAVIKSTMLPGTTRKLQEKHSNIIVLHSPEFLTEATAKYDAFYPDRNIIGYSNDKGEEAANKVMETLPLAPYKSIIPVEEAEMIKYAGNCWFYTKVIFINQVYDLCQKLNINYEMIKRGMSFDSRIGFTHLDPVHKTGRGAGGHCFIKDYAAFAKLYKELCPEDKLGNEILEATQEKNIELLKKTGKDLDLLEGVYGKEKIDEES